jgi:hypothetical protein
MLSNTSGRGRPDDSVFVNQFAVPVALEKVSNLASSLSAGVFWLITQIGWCKSPIDVKAGLSGLTAIRTHLPFIAVNPIFSVVWCFIAVETKGISSECSCVPYTLTTVIADVAVEELDQVSLRGYSMGEGPRMISEAPRRGLMSRSSHRRIASSRASTVPRRAGIKITDATHMCSSTHPAPDN